MPGSPSSATLAAVIAVTDNFALTAVVVIPVILLAAAVDGRAFEKDTRSLRSLLAADSSASHLLVQWLREIQPPPTIATLDELQKFLDAEAKRSRLRMRTLWLSIRAFAYWCASVLWGITLILLSVDQVSLLVWLADDHRKPDQGLAWMTIGAVTAALLLLCGTPAVRLAFSLPGVAQYFRGEFEPAAEMLAKIGHEVEGLKERVVNQRTPDATRRPSVRDARLHATNRRVPHRPRARRETGST